MIIYAEKSDLFDVLAHVAYALPALSREECATDAKAEIGIRFNGKQQDPSTSCSPTTSALASVSWLEKSWPLSCASNTTMPSQMPWPTSAPQRKSGTFAGFQKYVHQGVA